MQRFESALPVFAWARRGRKLSDASSNGDSQWFNERTQCPLSLQALIEKEGAQKTCERLYALIQKHTKTLTEMELENDVLTGKVSRLKTIMDDLVTALYKEIMFLINQLETLGGGFSNLEDIWGNTREFKLGENTKELISAGEKETALVRAERHAEVEREVQKAIDDALTFARDKFNQEKRKLHESYKKKILELKDNMTVRLKAANDRADYFQRQSFLPDDISDTNSVTDSVKEIHPKTPMSPMKPLVAGILDVVYSEAPRSFIKSTQTELKTTDAHTSMPVIKYASTLSQYDVKLRDRYSQTDVSHDRIQKLALTVEQNKRRRSIDPHSPTSPASAPPLTSPTWHSNSSTPLSRQSPTSFGSPMGPTSKGGGLSWPSRGQLMGLSKGKGKGRKTEYLTPDGGSSKGVRKVRLSIKVDRNSKEDQVSYPSDPVVSVPIPQSPSLQGQSALQFLQSLSPASSISMNADDPMFPLDRIPSLTDLTKQPPVSKPLNVQSIISRSQATKQMRNDATDLEKYKTAAEALEDYINKVHMELSASHADNFNLCAERLKNLRDWEEVQQICSKLEGQQSKWKNRVTELTRTNARQAKELSALHMSFGEIVKRCNTDRDRVKNQANQKLKVMAETVQALQKRLKESGGRSDQVEKKKAEIYKAACEELRVKLTEARRALRMLQGGSATPRSRSPSQLSISHVDALSYTHDKIMYPTRRRSRQSSFAFPNESSHHMKDHVEPSDTPRSARSSCDRRTKDTDEKTQDKPHHRPGSGRPKNKQVPSSGATGEGSMNVSGGNRRMELKHQSQIRVLKSEINDLKDWHTGLGMLKQHVETGTRFWRDLEAQNILASERLESQKVINGALEFKISELEKQIQWLFGARDTDSGPLDADMSRITATSYICEVCQSIAEPQAKDLEGHIERSEFPEEEEQGLMEDSTRSLMHTSSASKREMDLPKQAIGFKFDENQASDKSLGNFAGWRMLEIDENRVPKTAITFLESVVDGTLHSCQGSLTKASTWKTQSTKSHDTSTFNKSASNKGSLIKSRSRISEGYSSKGSASEARSRSFEGCVSKGTASGSVAPHSSGRPGGVGPKYPPQYQCAESIGPLKSEYELCDMAQVPGDPGSLDVALKLLNLILNKSENMVYEGLDVDLKRQKWEAQEKMVKTLAPPQRLIARAQILLDKMLFRQNVVLELASSDFNPIEPMHMLDLDVPDRSSRAGSSVKSAFQPLSAQIPSTPPSPPPSCAHPEELEATSLLGTTPRTARSTKSTVQKFSELIYK